MVGRVFSNTARAAGSLGGQWRFCSSYSCNSMRALSAWRSGTSSCHVLSALVMQQGIERESSTSAHSWAWRLSRCSPGSGISSCQKVSSLSLSGIIVFIPIQHNHSLHLCHVCGDRFRYMSNSEALSGISCPASCGWYAAFQSVSPALTSSLRPLRALRDGE